MKVLIIDDDAQILAMMSRLLTQRGHVVEACCGPFGASVRTLKGTPDVVLLDVIMPALDGVVLSNAIERLSLKPEPVIVLWSGDDDAVARAARETGRPTFSKHGNPLTLIGELERLHAAATGEAPPA
jgi:DNA-binding response OmpR family regulator